jgi:hypothetical protein
MVMKRSPCGLLVAVVGLALIPSSLEAYTDPGTGAMLWQLLVGAAIGSMFYLRRIINWFESKKR